MAKLLQSKPIKPVHFWSQKVLPLVYDDSLSYYETLGKFAFKLNEVIGSIDDLFENVEQVVQDYIREKLNDIFLNAIYDAETETLILVLEVREDG